MNPAENYPIEYEGRLTLKNGREIFIRPVKHSDEKLVIDLFNRLSSNSIYFRFLRQLNSLPSDMLYRFTHINYNSNFALAGIIQEDNKDAIIAIARYCSTPGDDLIDLAVAVRDDWQHYGIGKALLGKVVDIGKEHGIYRFWGMIDPQNNIIMRILPELGYKVNYHLKSGLYQVEILV